MNRLKINGLLFLLLFSAQLLAQSSQPEQLTVPLSNPGKPYSLKVFLARGTLKIIGYNGKDILVNADKPDSSDRKEMDRKRNREAFWKDNNNDNGEIEGMRRLSNSGSYEITAKENDNNVSINANSPNRDVPLTIRIPQDVKLKVVKTNGEMVKIDNVKGELEVSNTNGNILLTNIAGSVVANTTNGNITTSFSSVNAQATMAFTTFNGNVRVDFPAGMKANLKLNSERGEIYTDFDIDIDNSHPQANSTSKEKGIYKISKTNTIYGKINGGGPEIFMKTYNGNIYIKKAGSKL